MTKDVAYMVISLALVMSWQMIHVVRDVFAPRTIEPYLVYKVIHKTDIVFKERHSYQIYLFQG